MPLPATPCLRYVCSPKLKEPYPTIIRMALPVALAGVILEMDMASPPRVLFAAAAGASAFSLAACLMVQEKSERS